MARQALKPRSAGCKFAGIDGASKRRPPHCGLFSDILTQAQPFVIRPLETQEPKLTKNIRTYFLKENSQDSIIRQYIGFLREQISVQNRPK